MSAKMEMLKDKFCKELDIMADKRELSTTDLDRAWKLTDVIKNINKIGMMEEGGYSGDGEWEARGGYYRDYDRGSSYRRRDSMGRYARDGYAMDGYARTGGGYSGGTMQEHLDAMLRDAKTEDERRMIEDMRRKMM